MVIFKKNKVFQFFLSFSKFRPSRVHWALFFEKKPQNKFKTCLDTFGNVFGYLEFWEVFAFLWNFSTSLPSRVHWPKNFDKITSNLVWTLLVTFLDTFEISKCSRLFFELFQVSTLQGKLVIFFYQKNYLGECWKLVWTLLGKILVILKKKVFQFFLSFSKFRPSRVHWALFFREKPQNKFKTCLDTFGNVFGYLEFWEVFAFLWNFSTSLPSRVHWPKNFEKITSKHVWTILETFLDIFENLNSFPFLWIFFESPGCTGQRVFPSK